VKQCYIEIGLMQQKRSTRDIPVLLLLVVPECTDKVVTLMLKVDKPSQKPMHVCCRPPKVLITGD